MKTQRSFSLSLQIGSTADAKRIFHEVADGDIPGAHDFLAQVYIERVDGLRKVSEVGASRCTMPPRIDSARRQSNYVEDCLVA